ncbi:hypothetical protein O181_040396 [Austropuccinia psidii MF-1]|uniref:Uncharacterized protein n=1 Tax=Austropuccinia psidii MF-1 TaxID=1389203 RepID=A0A9Q3HDC6_9BASI|nr:hypothetical protein [Austropuccinia psidii MF-1]
MHTRANLASISLDLVGHVTSASRQRQSSHVSHENVTQSPNPFQHCLQCLVNFTSLACASPPNPPQRFACLRARTPLRMRLQHCPPSLSSALLTLSHPRPYHLYAHVVHSRHAPDTTYPYARGVHSQHAPDTTYPYACGVPPNTLLKPLILTLPYYIHSVRWLVGVHDERNPRNMLSGLLCQQDLRGNWSVYSQCCG